MLETPKQRLIALAIVVGYLAVLTIAIAITIATLSDDNAESLGEWVAGNAGGILTAVVGAVTSVATFLFGRRAGRKAGKTEAFSSAIATAEGRASGDEAARALREEATAHGLDMRVPV